jgi:hypothetical protein
MTTPVPFNAPVAIVVGGPVALTLGVEGVVFNFEDASRRHSKGARTIRAPWAVTGLGYS